MDSRYYEEIGKAVEQAKIHGGDLTTQNLLYVVKVAINVAKETGADENDLIAVGTEAMKKVEKKFDPTKHDSFVKACSMFVRGEMMNFVNRQTNLVHVPVNHQRGFRKGSEAKEGTDISYQSIDIEDYDNLGECSNDAFKNERDEIIRKGIKTLSPAGQKTIKIKLRLDEYKELKHNNFQFMADELEVPLPVAKKIYNDAFEKLSIFCQKEING